MKYSRRPITFAGMANMLRVIVPQCEDAQKNGDLQLTYEGVRKQNGRPCYVLKRVLPNKNNNPCSVLIIYIDKEYLACVRTDGYDWDGGLISQYIYSNFVINPGLTDKDFDPDNDEYGFRVF
jgi:outer membrane lipoprotein-sorting protein